GRSPAKSSQMNETERGVCFRELGIQAQGGLRGVLGAAEPLFRSKHAVRDAEHVARVRKAAVSKRELRIGGNGLLEEIFRLRDRFRIALVPVEASLQVQLVRLRITRGRLHAPALLGSSAADAARIRSAVDP